MIEVLLILLIHWIADFIFQDEKWALGKSKNWKDLLSHTIMYSYLWYIFGIVYVLMNKDSYIQWHLSLFVLITFICHTLTDYFTSRIVAKQFAAKKYGSSIPNFGAFTTIGFDQMLHFTQLLLTYQFLK